MGDLGKPSTKLDNYVLSPLDEDGTQRQPHQQAEDDSSSASSMSSTGTIIPTSKHDSPEVISPWTDFFSQELYLEQQLDMSGLAKYHIYLTQPSCSKAPLIVLHHGAGSSALTFALMVVEIRRLIPDAGILAVEANDHGSAIWQENGERDVNLSLSNLSRDLVNMLRLTQRKLAWSELPVLFLVGHSLGGAVVTDVAVNGLLGDKVLGYVVIDVVEGSAMEALKHMQAYLASRPTSFASVDAAVNWHIRSRTLRNARSARASVPSLFVTAEPGVLTWRTELSKTEAYWGDWFGGMSKKFLNAKGAKLLILAGTDRLDKDLMIGQMQGKFQLQVFPSAGHFVQEDVPGQTAEVIAEFIKRNDRSNLVLPPKVSDLLRQGKKV